MTPPAIKELAKTLAPGKVTANLQIYRQETERRQRAQETSAELRSSFRKFVPAAWAVVEPSHPYRPAWHVEAIAEHLQGVADGKIQNLLVNVPPGSAKSLLCSVMFPAWKWTYHPEWRSTFASYDSGLSTRDSVRCRDLLESVWYRETFQPQWKFATDQNEKTYYVNSAKGFRVSTSVTGRGTGWRSDTILCLHAGTLITTDQGNLPIEQIVDGRLPVRVLAYDHNTRSGNWRAIEGYESNPGRASVLVTLSDGTKIKCTDDHPVYVVGSGYVKAVNLQSGDALVHADSVCSVREGMSAVPKGSTAVREDVLRSRLFGHMEKRAQEVSSRTATQGIYVPALRRDSQGYAKGEVRRAPTILRAEMCSGMAPWGKSWPIPGAPITSMRGMRVADPANQEIATRNVQPLLFKGVLLQGTGEAYGRRRKSKLRRRPLPGTVFSDLPQDNCSSNPQKRRLPMSNMRRKGTAPKKGIGCSPCRLRQVERRSTQPSNSLQELPFAGSRKAGTPGASEAIAVQSVERIASPDRVFNIRVAEDHNYFASGVLLHNCDDPINVSDQSSDAVLERCILWWTNTMHNRLISMQHGSRIIIMQRISDRDLSGHVLRNGGWEHLMIPMEYDPGRSRVTSIGWHDPRQQRNELMCPEIFPQAVVDDTKKTLGESGWAGQYQQSPAPDGGGILKSHLWQYWQPDGAKLPPVKVKMPDGSIEDRVAVELPLSFDLQMQSWDFSFKDLKSSDYVAGAMVCVRGANRFIRDMMRAKMDLPASIAAVREMTGRYPQAHLKLVEDKANGPAVIQSLKNEISGLVEVNPEGDKISRAFSITPELESGNWFLPHPKIAPWVGDPANPTASGFIAESVMFPFGANDDMVDAISQSGVRIQKEKVGGVFGVSDSDIRVEPFDLKLIEKWPKLYGLSVTWREVASVWLCREPETSQHYLYAEYCAPAGDPAQHAAAIRLRGEHMGYMTSKIDGREIKDGYAVANKYRTLGLKLETIQNNEDTALIDLSEAFRSQKLRVFSNCGRFFDELRMFRRDPKNGRLPQESVGVIMACMAAWRAREKMRAPIDPNKKPAGRLFQSGIHGTGWMSS